MTITLRFLAAAMVATLLGVAPAAAQLFRPFTDRRTSLLEGNWQSCKEAPEPGEISTPYAERVYDGKWPGIGEFELHLGPYHEFALFKGIQDDHREHGAPENLLKPFNVDMRGNQARHIWEIPSLRLELAVTLAGGSLTDCESWFVVLRRLSDS